MNLNRIDDLATVGGRNPLETIDKNQITGFATVFVGICQLFIAFTVAGEQSSALFIMGGGGWLLIGIGGNLFRNMEPFENNWGVGERVEWLSTAALLIAAVAMVAAAVSIAIV